jgi:hypothetical protein
MKLLKELIFGKPIKGFPIFETTPTLRTVGGHYSFNDLYNQRRIEIIKPEKIKASNDSSNNTIKI